MKKSKLITQVFDVRLKIRVDSKKAINPVLFKGTLNALGEKFSDEDTQVQFQVQQFVVDHT